MIGILLYSFLVATSSCMAAPFLAHSKAVVAGKSGDHTRAQQLLQSALVASPHDASLLFDAGVSEFKCGNHENAAHYFEKAVEQTEKRALKHEALYNAGNAYAHLKEYDAALRSYEKILAEDVAHERARHNYEVVKKLKEQEAEQQQEQDKDNQKDEKQDRDKDQNNANDDAENDTDESGDDQSDKREHGKQHDNKQGKSKKNNEQNKDNQSSQDNDSEHDDQAADERDGSEDGDQQEDADPKNRDAKNQSSDQKEQQQKNGDQKQEDAPADGDEPSDEQQKNYNDKKQESRDAHAKPSDKSDKQDKVQPQSIGSHAAPQPGAAKQEEVCEQLAGPDKQWMRAALENCDKQDNSHNKQLLKAMVGIDKGDPRAVRPSW